MIQMRGIALSIYSQSNCLSLVDYEEEHQKIWAPDCSSLEVSSFYFVMITKLARSDFDSRYVKRLRVY